MNNENGEQLDCVVRVVTPENIEFDYMLAGPFQRLPAFIADLCVRSVLFTAITIICSFIGIFIGPTASLFIAFQFVLFFVLSWLYGAAMESMCNGRTIGKMIFRLRVISADGRPINASQASLRNLLRVADVFPFLSLQAFGDGLPDANVVPTCFFGLVAMTLTTRMQRLGDLAAGTMVVCDRVRGVSANLQPEDHRAFSLAEIIPPTFTVSRSLAKVIGLYMERRKLMHPVRRAELAANIAEPLIKKFGLLPDTSTDLLLCALYVRIYHSEDQRQQKLIRSRANPVVAPRPSLPQTQALAIQPPPTLPSHDIGAMPSDPWNSSTTLKNAERLKNTERIDP